MQSGANLEESGGGGGGVQNTPLPPKKTFSKEKNKFVQLTPPNYFSRLVHGNVREYVQSSKGISAIFNL